MKLSICSKGSMYQINEATKREIIKFTLTYLTVQTHLEDPVE